MLRKQIPDLLLCKIVPNNLAKLVSFPPQASLGHIMGERRTINYMTIEVWMVICG